MPAALVAGIAAAWVVASSGDHDGRPTAALFVLVAWSFIGSGLIAEARHPENRIPKLLVATGFASLAPSLEWARADLAYTASLLFENAYILGCAWLLLAFPTGRLEGGLERSLVVAGAVVVGPAQLAWMLFGYGDAGECARCPENLLEMSRQPDLSLGIVHGQQLAGFVLSAMTVGVLVRRWRRASRPLRRAAAPILLAGAVTFALLVLMVVHDFFREPLGETFDILVQLAFASVPFAFLAGLLRARLARAAVADLVVELGDAAQPGRLRDALARALGDSSLSVAYWLPDAGRYVDVDGRPVDVEDGDRRSATVVEREGRRIAALVHDPALRDEPELVQSVCAAAALALENERLQAELRARLEELRASRARIVEAADAERRRIERNLHDGTQQRLVSVAMALGLAEAKLPGDPEAAERIVREAREGLSGALAELRELSQGIHPGILSERGLQPALEELAYQAPIPIAVDVALDRRLPEPVEAAAYYVVCESLANVAKYAQATAVSVRVARENGRALIEVADDGVGGADEARGSGLRGLVDRVEALGGKFWLASPPGRGTVVRAEIPCG